MARKNRNDTVRPEPAGIGLLPPAERRAFQNRLSHLVRQLSRARRRRLASGFVQEIDRLLKSARHSGEEKDLLAAERLVAEVCEPLLRKQASSATPSAQPRQKAVCFKSPASERRLAAAPGATAAREERGSFTSVTRTTAPCGSARSAPGDRTRGETACTPTRVARPVWVSGPERGVRLK